ncbi:hypothetical protein EVAR_100529_1 [Eumeta japonica]|uniref:Uncharacterized protein n=1 Tax=Eumeta variegata TaxID=151549 RepID=A0A4C2A872_EUMVA|nr:hypothetical protein EVAR_100529_1 [Eumeta japonica]
MTLPQVGITNGPLANGTRAGDYRRCAARNKELKSIVVRLRKVRCGPPNKSIIGGGRDGRGWGLAGRARPAPAARHQCRPAGSVLTRVRFDVSPRHVCALWIFIVVVVVDRGVAEYGRGAADERAIVSRAGAGAGGGMVLEGGGLPAPLQLYAAAAAGLAPRPAWPPFLPFFGVPGPFLARPRLPPAGSALGHARAAHGPPSEDSNEDGASTKGT